jgi:hypothetical protein
MDWKALAKNPSEWTSLKYNDPRLDAFANEVEKKYGLPTGIVEALKNAGERTPSQDSGQPTISNKGAKGVMQFIDSTRKAYEHDVNDPFASIDAAGRYVKDLMNQYKNPMAAIAAYNGGNAAGKAVLQGKSPPAKETQDYLSRIKSYMSSKYGGK